MINTKFFLLASACVFLNGNIQASEVKNLTFDYSGSPLVNTHTTHIHTPNELKPISLFNPDNAVKLAAVCAVGGGGCSGLTFGSSDSSMGLDKNSQCEDDGYVRSCPPGQVKDENNLCPHDKSYFKCRAANNTCDDGYSLDRCTTPIRDTYTNEAGNTCYKCASKSCEDMGYLSSLDSCQHGTRFETDGKTCYKDVEWKDCDYGTYESSIPTNMICDEVDYCGQTCYESCHQPTCEESGFLTTCPKDHDCETITSGTYGRTCYKDTGQPSCADGGYKTDIPTNNVCTQVEYFGNRCFDNCYQPTCDAGGYQDSVPTNNKCTPVTYYGRDCQKDCYQPECSEGGYQDSVPTNNKCTPIAYYGRSCQKDCYQPQCSEGGYLDACPAGQSGTLTTYYGKDCYTNCKTETITPLPILYSDKTTSNTIIKDKTSIGVVFDESNGLALALKQSNTALKWSESKNDIPSLENCDSSSEPLSCGTDGKANTAAIIAYGKANNISYPAAEYCYNYTTTDTTTGDWHLPSFAELKSIYKLKDKINTTLKMLGKTTIKEGDYWYHSSTESTTWNSYWRMDMEEDYFNGVAEKTYTGEVRPVIKYEVKENTCVSGGSSTCTGGQTTTCSSSQEQTYSCKDCDGVTHYFCKDVQSPVDLCHEKLGPDFYPEGQCPAGMIHTSLEHMCSMYGSVNCCGCSLPSCSNECSRDLQAATWGICEEKNNPGCKCPNPNPGVLHSACR